MFCMCPYRHPEASSRPLFSDLLSKLCTLETELQLPVKRKSCLETEEDLYIDLQKVYESTET